MDVDVAIVGAGLAGTALARAARGLTVALVAEEGARLAPAAQAFDARVYAITPGNAAFLAGLGVWQRLAPERVTAVRAMRVFGDAHSALEFDAYRAGVSELAWIVEDGVLQAALWEALAAAEGVSVLAAERLEHLQVDVDGARLQLRGGRTLSARLVVGADGAQSVVREQAGIAVIDAAYPQRAVVANFACERAHRHVAYQWFQGGPVLALLPLPANHVSMVWSTSEEQSARLLALEPAELCRTVEAASGQVLGELGLATPPRAFPLRRLAARRMVAPRVALAGDAAHVLHPLAGQGANLGLQDARRLAAVLAAREPGRDPGDLQLLRRYERARAGDVGVMDATVHGLYRLFRAQARSCALARNAGLNLTEHVPVIKNLLIRQAMA
ncbi:MAG: FAD-dependent monooxygenase [Betaproteobacteria bacterium]|nr:FAD-dependent monooxygenase [Betaproteobacteria bacterium]